MGERVIPENVGHNALENNLRIEEKPPACAKRTLGAFEWGS